MKRRKKIWIACAALAVVVVLCAAALLYRPVPYKFLREASAFPPRLVTIYGTGSIESFTMTHYELDGSLYEVTARAREELVAENGWNWQLDRFEFPTVATHRASQRQVQLYIEPSTRPDHPGPVIVVVVYEPATWIDKIFAKTGVVPETL